MTTFRSVPVFISSAHHGLGDLRGELSSYLEAIGVQPLVSSERGFPDGPDLPPYAQCLRVLERTLIVVGILDRRYGAAFEEWGPYPEYRGLSPTHAELRHALRLKKRVMIYVRADVQAYYDLYRKNPEEFKALKLPAGLDISTLELFQELKQHKPAPWIESFNDVRDVKDSIQKRLLYDLYEALVQREAVIRAGAENLIQRILAMDPGLRGRLLAAVSHLERGEREEVRDLLDPRHEGARFLSIGGSAPGHDQPTLAPDTLVDVIHAVSDLTDGPAPPAATDCAVLE